MMGSEEKINHPRHYHRGKYETIKVIDAWNLNFNLGNAVKYISRAGLKGSHLEDLKKARWYLNHEIRRYRGRERIRLKDSDALDPKGNRDPNVKGNPSERRSSDP